MLLCQSLSHISYKLAIMQCRFFGHSCVAVGCVRGNAPSDYGWPSYSQLIIFTGGKNILTSGKNNSTSSLSRSFRNPMR